MDREFYRRCTRYKSACEEAARSAHAALVAWSERETQAVIAAELRISAPYLNEILRGKRDIRPLIERVLKGGVR